MRSQTCGMSVWMVGGKLKEKSWSNSPMFRQVFFLEHNARSHRALRLGVISGPVLCGTSPLVLKFTCTA